MASAEELKEQDHYHVLGLEADDSSTITTTQISQAYRKKALKYHPDKNKHKSESEREHAANMFLKVTKANEVLSDEAQRTTFDAKQNAKKMRKRKDMEMDSARKKMKDDLNRREEEAREQQQQRRKPAPEQEDLSWLNKNKPFKMPKADSPPPEATPPPSTSRAIKVKWNKKKTYSKEDITNAFSKYGEIDFVVLGEEKRKGRPNALVSFKSPLSAQTAMQNKTDSFKVSWSSKQPDVTPPPSSTATSQPSTPSFFSPFTNRPSSFASPFASPGYKSPFASPFGSAPAQAASSPADLEDLEMQTLRRMAEAAKRQKGEQKSAPPEQPTPVQPEQPTPDKANSDNNNNNTTSTTDSGNASYIHPLNFNTPPLPSTPQSNTNTNTSTSTNTTPNTNSYNYFSPTDFESMEERKLRQATERQKIMEDLASQSGNTVNS